MAPERAPIAVRVDRDPIRLGDREWYAAALEWALDVASRDGIVWPDELAPAMHARGVRVGSNVGAFWAWARHHGLRQADERRMSRDPERNGAKVFAWRGA